MSSILFSGGVLNDPLSIFFSLLIIIIFIPTFIYSLGYIKEYINKYSGNYNIFLLILFAISMLGVVLANDFITFMVFWEIMSFVSFFLVIFEYKESQNISSGIMYFIMTHISGFFLLFMFLLLIKFTGLTNLKDLSLSKDLLTSSQSELILILAIIGFGAKAGFVPVHVWLPKAHPSAPSNASALMSGVMLKVSLYGFIRIAFFVLKDISVNYALLVVVLGVITAIFSVFNALIQIDIKKLLAYSSAENIGIILSTLGLSLVFKSYGYYQFASLALTAALFHIFNHAVFKSLLFTGAGSVLFATGTKNMNQLGGLYNKMKFATICSFIGTAALAAVPPTNGFASEILILKSFVLAATGILNPWVVFIIIFSGVFLALTGGAAVYTAVKCFGITYLGSNRTGESMKIHKIPFTMNLGMGMLALICVFSGIFSPFIVKKITNISNSILNVSETTINNNVSYEVFAVSIILIVVTLFIIVLSKIYEKNNKIMMNNTWGCGFNNLNANMQYTGNGLSQPATRLFSKITGYTKKSFVSSNVNIKVGSFDIFEKFMYKPIVKFINILAGSVVKIHMGQIRIYVIYIFIALAMTVLLASKLI